MAQDKHHGQGGRFDVKNGQRVQVEAPTKEHEDGSRARDASGRALDQADSRAKPEPALPVPGHAPWEMSTASAAPAEPEAAKSSRKGA